MQIYGPAHLHGAQRIGPPHSSRVSQSTTPNQGSPINDELEISDAGRLIEQAKSVPDIRQDRVNAIRARIEAGTYETDEKLEVALDRLLDEIG